MPLANSKPARSPNRFLRFGIRTLLFVMLVASLPLTWWNLYIAPKANALRELRRLNTSFEMSVPPNPSMLERWSGIDIDMDAITSVYIPDTDTLAPLRYLPNVSRLESYGPVVDLSPIEHLENLYELVLQDTLIEDLAPLESLKNLVELDLQKSKVVDVSPLAALPELRKLNLSKSDVVDLKPLSECKHLTSLTLSETPISSLNSLKDCTELGSLNISKTNVKDISVVSEFTSLASLILDDTQVSDLTPLEALDPVPIFVTEHVTPEQAVGRKIISPEDPSSDPFSTHEDDGKVEVQTNRIRGYENGLLALSIRNTPVTSLLPIRNQICLSELCIDGAKLTSLEGIERLCTDSGGPVGGPVFRLDVSRTEITSLSPLATSTSLEQLRIEDCSIRYLDGIENNRSLTNLVLKNLRLDDISAIGGLPIENLFVENCEVTDLSPLSELKQLKLLSLTGAKIDKWPVDVDAMQSVNHLVLKSCEIRELPDTFSLAQNLELLDISDTQISDLSPLSALGSLSQLAAHNCPITDLTPLTSFPLLRMLEIKNSKVSDFEPLRETKRLERISLSGCDIDSIKILSNHKYLYAVDLAATRVTDLSPLTSSRATVGSLSLNGTPIKNLDPLTNFSNLWGLDISGTEVDDLGALSQIPTIEWLDISDTNVTSIAPLANCRALQVFTAYNVPIDNIDPLASRKHKQILGIEKTNISESALRQFAKENPESELILKRPDVSKPIQRHYLRGGVF